MKPSALRAIQHSIRFSLRLALLSLVFSVCSFAAVAAQSAFHFDLDQYRGASLTYFLVATGTLEVEDESGPPVTLSLEISSPIDITFSQETADGDLGFDLVLRAPVVLGLGEFGRQTFDPISLGGRLGPGGALREIETPPFLTDLGLDMTDLIIGLIVPGPVPPRTITPGAEWRATFNRGNLIKESPRSLNLTATYAVGRPVDWGNRILQSVTARLRADATLREGSMRTEIQEIGHALFYLRENGIPELSSVSLVTQIETRLPGSRSPVNRSKVTLTTTLELRDIAPFIATPGPSVEKESETIQPVTVPEDVSPEQVPTPAESAAEPITESTPDPVDESASRSEITPVEPDESPSAVDPIDEAVDPQASEPWIEPDAEQAAEPEQGVEPDAEPDAVPSVEPDAEPDAEPGLDPSELAGVEPDAEPSEPTRAEPSSEPHSAPDETTHALDETLVPPIPLPPPGLATPVKPTTVYRDPAGRFELGLGSEWVSTPRSISLRGTTFVTEDEKERAYVYVNPLPNPAATALAIAHSALATYGETQTSFRVLVEPELDSLDGEIAYRAKYAYTLGDERITEWALFARRRDRAYYIQYATVAEQSDVGDSGLQELHDLRDHFRFGEDPRGSVPVHHLQGSLTPYVDPLGRFRISVPTLWPRTEVAADGSSTIFTEIGEKGYLTILVQPGATGITAAQIVSAWKEQWALEDGYRLLIDITDAPLSGQEGVRFDYAWSGGASGEWTRRLHATVVDDAFVVVALDYEAAGYAERGPVFDQIIRSFALIQEPEAAPESGERLPGSPASQSDASPSPAAQEPAAPETDGVESARSTPPASEPPASTRIVSAPPENAPFDEPTDDEGVILLGRILTRYPGPTGQMEEAWASGVQVTVFVGQDEFQGVTDDLGYLYVANLPPLSPGRFYTIARLEGPMLGFVEPVTVSFDNLRIGQIGPRVAHLRIVSVSLNPNRSLSVDVIRSASFAPDDPSALTYFVTAYPGSAWAEHVEEVILSGLD